MFIAGIFFIVGTVFNAAAQNLLMLIIGRILLGCGVGFANQLIVIIINLFMLHFLMFISGCATVPFGDCTNKNPWGTNVLFQLNVTIGILFVNLINYGTSKIAGGWGWRLSLDLAGVPAAMLTLGSLVVVDTPNSLISRGKLEEGKAALKKIRGVDNVEPEFLEIVDASRVAKEVKHPFRNLLRRKNRPQLDIAILMQTAH
ncbi:hypothetical protein GBA52_004193 [Prunus armeniaca]|nr:hypothetical protein GBA52_004193 [Prunus armeniaca]